MSRVVFGDSTSVELCLSWQPASSADSDPIPNGAVDAGQGCFVARARHESEWVPGKLVRSQAGASMYISFGGLECQKTNYEVLVCTDTHCFESRFDWVAVKDAKLPDLALLAGSHKRTPLFVARGTRQELLGEMCTGKYYLGQKRAFVPWNGEEHGLDQFDVLVLK